MSVTALMEFAGMVFTRASLEVKDEKWWVEIRPTHIDNGCIALKTVDEGVLCLFYAVEENMAVSVDVMATVADHYVQEFVELIQLRRENARSSTTPGN